MKNHYLFNKLKAEGRPPPPFACVSAFCAGVATHTEYNIYCTTTGILPVFSTMLKATAHESYTPLPCPGCHLPFVPDMSAFTSAWLM